MELLLTVDFNRRYPPCWAVGQGEWQVVVRNGENRLVFPHPPTALGYAKLEKYPTSMGNCELEVSATHDDSESDFDMRQVSKSKQDRRRRKIGDAESAVVSLKELFANFLDKAINMFRCNDATGRVIILIGLEDLGINGECILEL